MVEEPHIQNPGALGSAYGADGTTVAKWLTDGKEKEGEDSPEDGSGPEPQEGPQQPQDGPCESPESEDPTPPPPMPPDIILTLLIMSRRTNVHYLSEKARENYQEIVKEAI